MKLDKWKVKIFVWLMKTEISADFQRSVTRFILKVGN